MRHEKTAPENVPVYENGATYFLVVVCQKLGDFIEMAFSHLHYNCIELFYGVLFLPCLLLH